MDATDESPRRVMTQWYTMDDETVSKMGIERQKTKFV
jgi:hypothetical protein